MGGICREETLMASFYLDAPRADGEIAPLAAEESRHVLKVLRMNVGDELCAIDGCGGRFEAKIDSVDQNTVWVKLCNRLPDNESAVRITLYQGLPKADKLDFIVQKLTELGGACVCPVKMERSVVKSDAKDGIKRRERLEKIAREATKQCRRATAPEITEPLSWKQAFARMKEHELILVPWEDARGVRMKDIARKMPEANEIGIVIGPEGGMSEAEVDAMRELGARAITLGPRILRAETAAVASVAMAMTLWGDL
ncbi:MAG: 16S rRNA (uracil(1498)-N(3))-methyltransferase [Clostridia bacterium]|nr:16S rRNA (uracil(1498)-N(3))-methyltransferase [Clostridia bacterium]